MIFLNKDSLIPSEGSPYRILILEGSGFLWIDSQSLSQKSSFLIDRIPQKNRCRQTSGDSNKNREPCHLPNNNRKVGTQFQESLLKFAEVEQAFFPKSHCYFNMNLL